MADSGPSPQAPTSTELPQPRPRFRFRLWQLVFLLFATATLLGVARQNAWLVCWVWLPCCLLTWLACQRPGRLRSRQVWWCAAPVLTLTALMPATFTVIGPESWLILGGWCIWSLWCAGAFDDYRRWIGQIIPLSLLLACVWFAHDPPSASKTLGVRGHTLIDIRGGRQGVSVQGLRLGWSGPETGVIESFVGPVPARWRQRHEFRGRLVLGVDNLMEWLNFDDEHASPLHGGLGKCLEKLPHDEARQRVLRALTDDGNHLRLHQAVLLLCLVEFDCPPHFTAESWWLVHAPVFEAEYDWQAAVWKVRDWKVPTQHAGSRIAQLNDVANHALLRTVPWMTGMATLSEISLSDRAGDQPQFRNPPEVVWWPPYRGRKN